MICNDNYWCGRNLGNYLMKYYIVWWDSNVDGLVRGGQTVDPSIQYNCGFSIGFGLQLTPIPGYSDQFRPLWLVPRLAELEGLYCIS